MFQSLTGRLKTRRALQQLLKAHLFQSLTGRLKTDTAVEVLRVNTGFNPSQVG